MSCFQCDLDIPHVCYAGMPNARWGLGDEAMAVLEGAQRHGFIRSAVPAASSRRSEQRRAQQAAKKKRRASR